MSSVFAFADLVNTACVLAILAGLAAGLLGLLALRTESGVR
jgi:hypothetical protein